MGKCPNSDALRFFHPPSKKLISYSDGYRFDTFMPTGTHFNLKMDGNFYFNTKSDEHNYHLTSTHEEHATKYIKENNIYHAFKILNIPVDPNTEPYVVQIQHNGDIIDVLHDNLHENDPNKPINLPLEACQFPQHP